MFTVAVAQTSPALGDLDHNILQHLHKINQASILGADLVVFPELSLTGYNLHDLAPDVAINLKKSDKLAPLLEVSRNISMLIGLVEESDSYVYYNSAVLLEGGEIRRVHRKVYLPTYGIFDEERIFSPGKEFKVFDSPAGSNGILICEDFWHPSSCYLLAMKGACVVHFMSNSPINTKDLQNQAEDPTFLGKLLQVNSRLYGIYSIYANRVGFEDGVGFGGGSRIIDPSGKLVTVAGNLEEEILLAEIDLDLVRRARINFPHLGDEKRDLVLRELGSIVKGDEKS